MEIYFLEPKSSLAASRELSDENIQNASEALPAIGEALAQPIKKFWNSFSDLGNEPDEVVLNFKLLFEGKAGWAIVSARSEASLTISLKWSKDQSSNN